MPSVIGMGLAQAQAVISVAIADPQVTIQHSDPGKVPPGMVIRQRPAAGIEVASGSHIELTVSTEPDGRVGMSWDIVLLHLPEDARSLADLPRDFDPPPLGNKAPVLAAVTRAVPEADLSDPEWGLLDGLGWSIELNIGSRDPVDSIMLHMRGGGDDILIPVFRLAAELGCQVIDCSDGELLSSTEEIAGWHAFQQFRGHILNDNS